jgi:4-hydroxymandelate oxidase
MSYAADRRNFLRFLAASPLFANTALAEGLRWPDPMEWAPHDPGKLIADPTQALNVFDFEPVMKANVPPAHFGYMATGVDDELTLRANRDGFQKFELRPRRLVDVSKIDMSLEIFGAKFDSPIVIAPTGSNRAFHPDAEIAVAKAAKLGNHLQILSTVATTSIEDAIAARGAPVWFQLYTTQKWEVAEALIKRAEGAGAPAIAVTLDVRSSAKWETFTRLRRTDTRECGSCHGLSDYLSRKPNFSDISLGGVSGTAVTNLTWDTVKRLRDRVKVKLVLKGILTAEDARLAADAGIDGSSSPTMAGGPRTACQVPSPCCPKSSRPSAAGCRCWSTAVFVAAAISSRRSRSGRARSVSEGRICGGSAPSASLASSAYSASCATRPVPPCSSSARRR